MKKMIIYLLIAIVALFILFIVVGLSLPKEKTFVKTAQLKSDIGTVFNLVTDFNNQAGWRKDVKEIVVIDSITWTEVPKKGTAITFKVKEKKENETFKIAIVAPKNLSGYWVARFKPTANGGTTVEFKEVITVSNPLFRTMTYLFVDLNKTMDMYLENLKLKLEE